MIVTVVDTPATEPSKPLKVEAAWETGPAFTTTSFVITATPPEVTVIV